MSKYCSKCGAENKSDSQFCEKCGWNLSAAYQPPVEPVTEKSEDAQEQEAAQVPLPEDKPSLSTGKVCAFVIGAVVIICIFSVAIWRSLQPVETPVSARVSSMASSLKQNVSLTDTSTSESSQSTATSEITSVQSSATSTEKEPVKLLEDDNIEVYYLRHSITTVYFRVKNKTSYPLTFQCKSIAFDGESTDDLIMSENIAPNSESVAVLECRGIFPTGDVSTLSGQFRYRIENENGDIETPSFSNIEIK